MRYQRFQSTGRPLQPELACLHQQEHQHETDSLQAPQSSACVTHRHALSEKYHKDVTLHIKEAIAKSHSDSRNELNLDYQRKCVGNTTGHLERTFALEGYPKEHVRIASTRIH